MLPRPLQRAVSPARAASHRCRRQEPPSGSRSYTVSWRLKHAVSVFLREGDGGRRSVLKSQIGNASGSQETRQQMGLSPYVTGNGCLARASQVEGATCHAPQLSSSGAQAPAARACQGCRFSSHKGLAACHTPSPSELHASESSGTCRARILWSHLRTTSRNFDGRRGDLCWERAEPERREL